MSEKLASAEIDESRERFEKEALKLGLVLTLDEYAEYKWLLEKIAWKIHLAAERDTRERCAQIVYALSKTYESQGQTLAAHYAELVGDKLRGVNR